MTHVKPSAREEIVRNFNRPGELHYASLIAGHSTCAWSEPSRADPYNVMLIAKNGKHTLY